MRAVRTGSGTEYRLFCEACELEFYGRANSRFCKRPKCQADRRQAQRKKKRQERERAARTVANETLRSEPPWSSLDPGIRELVRFVWDAGFAPRDSGDGVSKFDSWQDTSTLLAFPHVFCISARADLIDQADKLRELLNESQWAEWSINATYEPGCPHPHGEAIILVFGPEPS